MRKNNQPVAVTASLALSDCVYIIFLLGMITLSFALPFIYIAANILHLINTK